MSSWNGTVVVLVILFTGGLIVGKISERPRIPDVAAYLIFGIFVGPSVFNIIREPSQSQVNQFILNVGATIILFDGGRGVALSILRKTWVTVTLLSTVGVFVSAAAVGFVAHLVFHSTWTFALLVGAVIASTDPATLIPVFKRVPVLPRLRQTVESESAFNDATGTVLTFALLGSVGAAATSQIHWGRAFEQFIVSAGVGLGVGISCGLLCLVLVARKAWGIFHEYGSFVMLTTAIAAFEISSLLHASGFMAAFAAGVIAGNAKTFGWELAEHTEANVHHFGSVITLIMRMLIFVLLGTQVNFAVVLKYLPEALAVVLTLMLIARPLTVFSSVFVDRDARWEGREIAFMCWVRETGVIPAALSGVLVAKKVPGADIISAVTFMAILLTILIQASSTDFAAKKLGLLEYEPAIEEI